MKLDGHAGRLAYAVALGLFAIVETAAQGLKQGNNEAAQPRPAAEQLKSFKLPPGLLPHQLEFAPGNWLVFSQGVLNNGTAVTTTGKRVNFDKTVVARMRPDGSDLEVIGAGPNNIWSWTHGRDGRVFIHEANDLGYAVVPFEQDTIYPSFIKRLVHPNSPYHPPTRGMLVVFNPLNEPVTKKLRVNLYYTGLTDSARIREQDGLTKRLELERDYSVEIPVTVKAQGMNWFVIE